MKWQICRILSKSGLQVILFNFNLRIKKGDNQIPWKMYKSSRNLPRCKAPKEEVKSWYIMHWNACEISRVLLARVYFFWLLFATVTLNLSMMETHIINLLCFIKIAFKKHLSPFKIKSLHIKFFSRKRQGFCRTPKKDEYVTKPTWTIVSSSFAGKVPLIFQRGWWNCPHLDILCWLMLL